MSSVRSSVRSLVESSVGSERTVLCLMGPTASGKTGLAIALNEALPVEIISVDSALVYRAMDIGSAKPSAAEMEAVPHHLIDIRDPSEPYSAASFRQDAQRLIDDIQARGRLPVLAGGTMLYFKALIEGMSPMPESDADTRRQIESEAAEFGWPHLHEQLAEVDPQSASRIHPNHSQRIGRALEVYRLTGKPLSDWWAQGVQGIAMPECHNVVQVGLMPHDRALLHRRIEARFDEMMAEGLIDEVKRLMSREDLHADLPSIRAVGYRQVWEHLLGHCDRGEMREKALAATRQLAKRQLTWLRGWNDLHAVYIDSVDGVPKKKDELLSEILNLLPQTIL